MGDSGAVRFRVFKGSKFLFECEIARPDTLPATLRQQVVRPDDFALLRNVDLLITKRLNLVEVDRMIACCRSHPPQAVATPIVEYGARENQVAFEEFASYLKQRERAGVATLFSGMLVLLIPLMGRNNYMQCQLVNTRSTVGEIGAQVFLATPRELQPVALEAAATLATLPAHEEDVVIKEEVQSPAGPRAHASAYEHPDFVTQAAEASHQPRPLQTTAPVVLPTVASGAAAHQQPPVADTYRMTSEDTRTANNHEDLARRNVNKANTPDISRGNDDEKHGQSGTAIAAATDADMEPEPENDDPYAALRQEYDAFNAFYHHVLLEWSTKPSDIDSASELRRQALL